MTGPSSHSTGLVVRRVTVSSSLVLIVTDVADSGAFGVEIVPPKAQSTPDVAPRNRPAWTLRWREGPWGPPGGPFGPSSRIQVGTVVYEALNSPRPLLHGRRTVAHEVSVLPIADLYPYLGDLTDQGGVVVLEDVALALWAPSEAHAATGDYEDYDAESPPEYVGSVVRNRQIHIGDDVYRVMTSTVDRSVPRVSYRVRLTL